MSRNNTIVKVRERPDGGRSVLIPAAQRPLFEDVDFFEASTLDGCILYRPVRMSPAAIVRQDTPAAGQPANHSEVISNV